MTFAEDVDALLDVCCRLETLQEEFLELHDLLDVSEQTLHVVARQKRLLLQRLQVALNQTVEILNNNRCAVQVAVLVYDRPGDL